MDMIINEVLEMCGNDKNCVRKIAEQLLDLCNRTDDYFEENELLGYCECCGIPIHEGEVYAKIGGVYYCDYCGGEDGMAISEQGEK